MQESSGLVVHNAVPMNCWQPIKTRNWHKNDLQSPIICIHNAVHHILISKCEFISYSQNDECSNYTLVILSFFHGHKKFLNLVFPFRFLLLYSEPFMYMFAFLKFKHYGAHTNWFSSPLNSKQSLSSLTNIECRWRRNETLA